MEDEEEMKHQQAMADETYDDLAESYVIIFALRIRQLSIIRIR